MSKKIRKAYHELLGSFEIIYNNSVNDEEIFNAVSQYGYNKEKFDEGYQIYQKASKLRHTAVSLKGEKENLTEELKKAFKVAVIAYQNLSKVVKAIFSKEEGKLAQLGLHKRMPRTIAGFSVAANILFDNALSIEEIKSELSKYGYDENRLLSEKQKIIQYNLAVQAREAVKGDSQQTTKDQEQAFQELSEWMSKYIKIARVALSEKPELLEKIGIKVKPRAKRKNTSPE